MKGMYGISMTESVRQQAVFRLVLYLQLQQPEAR